MDVPTREAIMSAADRYALAFKDGKGKGSMDARVALWNLVQASAERPSGAVSRQVLYSDRFLDAVLETLAERGDRVADLARWDLKGAIRDTLASPRKQLSPEEDR